MVYERLVLFAYWISLVCGNVLYTHGRGFGLKLARSLAHFLHSFPGPQTDKKVFELQNSKPDCGCYILGKAVPCCIFESDHTGKWLAKQTSILLCTFLVSTLCGSTAENHSPNIFPVLLYCSQHIHFKWKSHCSRSDEFNGCWSKVTFSECLLLECVHFYVAKLTCLPKDVVCVIQWYDVP